MNVLSPRALLLAGLLLLGLINGLLLRQLSAERTDQLEQVRVDLDAQVRVFHAFVGQALQKVDYIAADLTRRPLAGDMDAELRRLRDLDPMLMDLLLLDAEGRIRHWSGTGAPPLVADRDYYTALRDTPSRERFITGALLSRAAEGRWFFALSRRRNDAQGGFAGVAVVVVRLDGLHALMQRSLGTGGASLAVFRHDGWLLARVPAPAGGYAQRLGVPATMSSVQHSSQLQRRVGASPLDGQQRLASWLSLPDLGLWVVATRTQTDAEAAWQASLRARLPAWLALNFALLLAGWTLLRAVRRNRQQLQALQQLREQLQAQAWLDPLTGVPNRRHFTEQAAAELSRWQRQGGSLSLLLADIDHFKQINDSQGHAAGDRVLVAVAETLKAHLRASDLLARYGGEEFALLLPATDALSAAAFAERLRGLVAQLHEAQGWSEPVTLSLGWSELRAGEAELAPALARADAALYAAKRAGRNRVAGQ